MPSELSRPNGTKQNLIVHEVWNHKWRIVGAAVLGAAAALGIGIVLPAKYETQSALLLPVSSAAGGSNIVQALMGKESSPLSILNGIANSDRTLRPVAAQNGMSIMDLRKVLTVTADPAANQIEIKAITKSKTEGVKLVSSTLQSLDRASRQVSLEMAKDQASEIKEALEQKEGDLKKAEDQLLAFQNRMKTVPPDPTKPYAPSDYLSRLRDVEFDLAKTTQELGVARNQATRKGEGPIELPTGNAGRELWRQKVVDLEYQLRTSLTTKGPLNPDVIALQRALDVTKEQLRQEMSNYLLSVRQDLDPSVADLVAKKQILQWQRDYVTGYTKLAPAEAIEFQRLVREVTTRDALAQKVRDQYNESMLGSEVYRIQYTTLVPPTALELPVNKDLSQYALIGLIAGLGISLAWVAGRFVLQAEPVERPVLA